MVGLTTLLLAATFVTSPATILSIPGSATGGAALAVNSNQEVVGYVVISGVEQPAYWATPASSATLLPVPSGGNGRAVGINDNGEIVGTVYVPTPLAHHVFFCDTSSLSTYTEVPTSSSIESNAYALSSNGVAAGDIHDSWPLGAENLYRDSATFTTSGYTNRDQDANAADHALDVASTGTYVGFLPGFFNFDTAYFNNGTKTTLGTGRASAINDSEEVTGVINNQYFLWNPSSTFVTVPLPSGTQNSWGYDISPYGDIGGTYTPSGGGNFAFLTKFNGSTYTFYDLTTYSGTSGVQLVASYGVANNGSNDAIVVGEANVTVGFVTTQQPFLIVVP